MLRRKSLKRGVWKRKVANHAPKGFRAPRSIQRARKRRKRGELTKLKDKLWQLIRIIIIKRYGNTCFCCGTVRLQGSNLHIGHFITSSTCSVELRYSLDNLRPSCYRCNIHLSGNWIAYERHLITDGIDIDELKRRNEETKGKLYKLKWFESKILEYSKLLTPTEDTKSEQ